ncbi:vascular endothelial growth factor C isoform X2 [Denticeps clupeoides]|uniref:vascular endothelial growth factor C isoform X2 n=1 Tax=Denticeps clupeoides TaxID=299321 RepID=UPI0010A3270C|nr:vascular endothelial growth factor C isoform X2 [Denticeps clupeoides]
MHLFGLSALLAFSAFFYTNRATDTSHDDYDYDQDQRDAAPSIVEQLRSVSSVDELMRIVYPSYWTILKCRSKRGARYTVRDHVSTETRSDKQSMFAAAYINFDILKSIESEWRKTLCMPREVCLDVGKEFGAATNTFYKPPCVSVYRCGGCCNSEEHQCMNISTSYISKTLFEITVPIKQGTKPVTISFANHTLCRCLSKLDVYRQVHSIIRRALPECLVANKTCPKNHSWNNHLCRCVLQEGSSLSSQNSAFETDICGPKQELDEETCQCVCRKHLSDADCGPNRYLDKDTCQCVCKAPPSCGPNQMFNKETCQCTCAKVCPESQPLNRTKCVCECTESPNRCFLKGRRFHQGRCSCYRPPCVRKRCEKGFNFSEAVCRCIPEYWRRLD